MPEHLSMIVLGALILRPSLLESTDELDASLFIGKEKKMFLAICETWEAERPDSIDIARINEKLGTDELDFLAEVTSAGRVYAHNPEGIKSMIGELVKKKLAKEIFKKIYEQSGTKELDLSEIKPLLTRYEVAGDKDRKLAEDVRTWVNNEAHGEFNLDQINAVLGVVSVNGKAGVRQVLARMVKEGIVDHSGKGYGRYRKVGKLADPIDLMATVATPIDLYLPLGLDKLVYLYPKSVIVVAGEGQQGKTAIALDFIKNNMRNYDVRYYFTEGGPEELRSRLEKHTDLTIPEWTMTAFEHQGHIADIISPDAVNVYDYLYVPDPFYIINDMFQDIHKKLNKGVAFINLQKNRNRDVGLGGDFGTYIPRLYVTLTADKDVLSPAPDLQYVTARIHKGKGWKKGNPDGKVMPFTIREGWQIEQRCNSWEYAESHDTVRRKKIF